MRAAEASALFDRHAATYDSVNHLISLGMDRRWRRWVAAQAVRRPHDRVLDVMGGAGEVALECARLGADVTLVDISPGMLERARSAARDAGVVLDAVETDVTAPSALPPGPFDAATISFGLRYLDEPSVLLGSLAEVLRDDARVVMLEFVVPEPGILSFLASFYFFRVLPRIAAALSPDADLHRYLRDSTRRIGRCTDIRALVRAGGLVVELERTFGFGLVCGIVARRDDASALLGGSESEASPLALEAREVAEP